MKLTINMIGIITQNLPAMKTFYTEVLGMEILLEMEQYVEFKQNGVRFALSTADVMQEIFVVRVFSLFIELEKTTFPLWI